jgi:hypothetical protein
MTCKSGLIGIYCPLVAFNGRFATVSMVEGEEPEGRKATSMLRLTELRSGLNFQEGEEEGEEDTNMERASMH